MMLAHERALQDCKDTVATIRMALKSPQTSEFDLEVLLRKAKLLCSSIAEHKFAFNKERPSSRAVEEEAAKLLISIKVAKLHDTIRNVQRQMHEGIHSEHELLLVLTRIETELWAQGDEPPASSFAALYAYENAVDDLIFRANLLTSLIKAQ
jgi:hypothetical protein